MGCGASTAVAETPTDENEKKLQLVPLETSHPAPAATVTPTTSAQKKVRSPSLVAVSIHATLCVAFAFSLFFDRFLVVPDR